MDLNGSAMYRLVPLQVFNVQTAMNDYGNLPAAFAAIKQIKVGLQFTESFGDKSAFCIDIDIRT